MSLHLNQLLSKLSLNGALLALQEQIEQPGYSNMSFEDRLVNQHPKGTFPTAP